MNAFLDLQGITQAHSSFQSREGCKPENVKNQEVIGFITRMLAHQELPADRTEAFKHFSQENVNDTNRIVAGCLEEFKSVSVAKHIAPVQSALDALNTIAGGGSEPHGKWQDDKIEDLGNWPDFKATISSSLFSVNRETMISSIRQLTQANRVTTTT